MERAGDRMHAESARATIAIEAVRAHPQDPGVFAAYFDVAHALFAEDLERARTTFDELLERTADLVEFEIVPYSPELGIDYERFPRLVFAEFSAANPMVEPEPELVVRSTQVIRDALDVIADVDPSIRAEIDGLVLRIFIAGEGETARPFGGGTSLMTWGATFFNVDGHPDGWSTTQFLAHEVLHSVLLGRSVSSPLVENSIHEEYPSPLRQDLRPMDGIYHATLVCGRLVAFNRAWIDGGAMTPEDRARSEQALISNAARFDAGVETIVRDGRLSELGAELLDDSRRLVAAAR